MDGKDLTKGDLARKPTGWRNAVSLMERLCESSEPPAWPQPQGDDFAVWQAERLLGLIARTSSCQIRMDPSSVMVQPWLCATSHT